MTRSKIRENVFKMLFRVEFHDKSELAEQMERDADGKSYRRGKTVY